jgi:SPP1 family predicted phage head-tail adaptor
LQQNKHQQVFNDGIVTIYSVTNSAAAGDNPVEKLTLKESLHYAERTVGLNRHYAASMANVDVKYVLRCPRRRCVSNQDIAIPNDGRQYQIEQVQYPEDIRPPVMDLTLEEITANYDIEDV